MDGQSGASGSNTTGMVTAATPISLLLAFSDVAFEIMRYKHIPLGDASLIKRTRRRLLCQNVERMRKCDSDLVCITIVCGSQ